MSEAVAVLHGAFGRVCLYSMDGRFASVHDFRLRKTIQFPEQRVCEPVELDTRRARGRPVYKLFRQQVGVTPNIYLNSLRMERAIERLTGTARLLRRSGSIWAFQSGELLALLHRQWRRPAQRLSAQRADRLLPMNHKFTSNVHR